MLFVFEDMFRICEWALYEFLDDISTGALYSTCTTCRESISRMMQQDARIDREACFCNICDGMSQGAHPISRYPLCIRSGASDNKRIRLVCPWAFEIFRNKLVMS